MFIVLSLWLRVILRVHLVHTMTAEPGQMTADLDQADGLERQACL